MINIQCNAASRTQFRRARVLLALTISLLALPILVACAAGGQPAGRVNGTISQRSGSVDMTPWPEGAYAQVTATLFNDATQSYSVTTNDGSFAFELPPGTYELTAIGLGTASPVEVTVTAGEIASAELFFNFP